MQSVSSYMPVLEAQPRLQRIRARAYTLTLVAPLRPTRGLTWSVLIHAAVIVSLPYVSPLLRETRITLPTAYALEARYESVQLPALPARSGSRAPAREKSAEARSAAAKTAGPEPVIESSALPETIYAGTQEIVSNLRRATNTVQTIRRPDLVEPPKLKFPFRVQSMLLLAPPVALPKLLAPVPQEPRSQDKMAAQIQPVDTPVIALRRYEPRRTKAVDISPPKLPTAVSGSAPALIPSRAPVPVLSPEVKVAASQTAIVINAVTLPPEIPKTVPNAEVTASFAVLRMQTEIAPDPPPSHANGNVSNRSVTATLEPGRLPIPKSGDGGGIGSSGNGPGAGSSASGSSNSGSDESGKGDGAGPNAGSGTGSSNYGIPGISIAGGVAAPHLARTETIVRPAANYDLVIVSSGSSGGATRDLGVFDHSHAVYTVYISMYDVGGGPDWSMQYALAGQSREGEGLLIAPLPRKKVPALVSNPRPGRETQFVAAIIDVNGKPENVRPVGGTTSNSEIAVEALKQWRFTPAELNGKPQAIQVLVGVVVTNKTMSR